MQLYFEKQPFIVEQGCSSCGKEEKTVQVWLDRVTEQEKHFLALYFIQDGEELKSVSVLLQKEQVTSAEFLIDELSDLAKIELRKMYPHMFEEAMVV